MLTIKMLFTINLLEKKKKLFIQNTIYKSCRFKKNFHFNKKKLSASKIQKFLFNYLK